MHNTPKPFNPAFRPGLSEAVQREYERYCESPKAPKGGGANAERAREYDKINSRLKPKYPPVG